MHDSIFGNIKYSTQTHLASFPHHCSAISSKQYQVPYSVYVLPFSWLGRPT